jgi:hypothetical protein
LSADEVTVSTPWQRLRYRALIVTVALIASSCSSNRTHTIWTEWNQDPANYGDTFDWNHRSPTDFLHKLEQSGNTYSVLGIHHEWIGDSDVEKLMSLLDSETPCAYVKLTVGSFQPNQRSTIGREAAFLLEGYRHHYYPPKISSAGFKPDLEELRSWYAHWRTRK